MPAIPLPRTLYERRAPELAPDLLGCLLVREHEGRLAVGRIVEVEAYLGEEDAASHAHRGPTPRSRIMFGPAGYAYVYFIYGTYYCLNVVTGREGQGEAILIRALEPVTGIEAMYEWRRRGHRRADEAHSHSPSPHRLANGPGKLCQSLAIDKALNGHDLTRGERLWIEAGAGASVDRIGASPRVGVRGDELARSIPWRFFLAGDPCVSPTPLNRFHLG